MQAPSTQHSSDGFRLKVRDAYTSVGPSADSTSFLISGLLPSAGLSILAAPPKCGKSSLARFAAVCVSKGTPFLGRQTQKGEVLLVSLEDPSFHTINALRALEHDPDTDSRIQACEEVAPTLDEMVTGLRAHLTQNPATRLIILDHVAKTIRVRDLSDYSVVQPAMEKLSRLAREAGVHILCLAHTKKVQTDDPFDAVLGSTALRAESDTNICLGAKNGQRTISTETRVGVPLRHSALQATVVEIEDTQLVSGFSLGAETAVLERERAERSAQSLMQRIKLDILAFLEGCEGRTATKEATVAAVTGKVQAKYEAIKTLANEGIISATEKPSVLTLQLGDDALALFRLGGNDE